MHTPCMTFNDYPLLTPQKMVGVIFINTKTTHCKTTEAAPLCAKCPITGFSGQNKNHPPIKIILSIDGR